MEVATTAGVPNGHAVQGTARRYLQAGRWRLAIVLLSLLGLFVLAGAVAVMGISQTGMATLLAVVVEKISFGLVPANADPQQARVLLHLRLPRVVMAIVAGGSLAFAGVLMQAITRNPLVSPYTIGVSSAAAFGASVAIMFGVGFSAAGLYFVPLTAFLFALGCAALVFSMAWLRGMGAQTMVLTGIALMYLFSAMTAAVQFVATQEQLARVVHWTFGSLNGIGWDAVVVAGLALLVALPLAQAKAWQFNALTSAGDDVSRSLGINVAMLRGLAVVLSVVVSAVVISFTGVIGFVGLIGPHVGRLIIGSDHRYLIPFASICGAALLLLADTVGRMVFSPTVIPVGIVVAFVGVPLFLHLILSRRSEYFS
ncbi:iron ABC transporter permease [Aminobacter sp. AP02]|uniref:FecCD family ABC transporter permease n=1 Tax=Aminobacter sp. AP02 TaxID=2135737 RepID=UPI000D6CAD74|nr:iron ABC transporter permease [Aminobacter sp. AP02]PWK65697.1 iron complex transport system permease protein [Aminobacter sp. AP02]